ncbi:MAG: DUF1844 domain-containing protein [Thermoanaerobaculia bacterium]
MGEIKVTDRRMFTPDGRVREGYVEVDAAPEPATASADAVMPAPIESAVLSSAAPASPQPQEPHEPPEPSKRSERSDHEFADSPRLELPSSPPELGGPGFYDLIAVLAEPVSIYLGDVELPDGQSAENLEMARLHIDLLDLLRQRTAGNLSAQESAVLDDLLYRLRVRYVQKRG